MITVIIGDGRDERFWMMDLRATANAGLAIIVVLLAAFLFELAHAPCASAAEPRPAPDSRRYSS